MSTTKTWPTVLRVGGFTGLLALAITGCDPESPTPAAPPPPPATSSPSAAMVSAVGWMDGFCGVVRNFIDGSNTMPAVDGETVEEIKRGTSEQLGHYAGILGKTVEELKGLPASPVPAGDSAKKNFLEKYGSALEKTTKAKADLDASAKSDNDAQSKAVDGLIAAQKDAHGALDPVEAVGASPELTTAATTAHRCKP
jgi:hypothetical protein